MGIETLISRRATLRRALLILIVSALSACVTTQPDALSANLEIQEAVGFTITEEARIAASVRADYESALRLLEQGRHEEGVALLERVAEDAPQFSAPRIDLGIAQHRAGDLVSAERHLKMAIELNADHPIAHNELGIVYRKTGRFAEARRSYEAALAIYPGYHFARRNLAVLCDLYLADLACALDNYEAYMATVPRDDEASMWIADLRMRRGSEEQ
jgi:Flp pilus assembly protein TadD